jgi:hypothetical protein
MIADKHKCIRQLQSVGFFKMNMNVDKKSSKTEEKFADAVKLSVYPGFNTVAAEEIPDPY